MPPLDAWTAHTAHTGTRTFDSTRQSGQRALANTRGDHEWGLQTEVGPARGMTKYMPNARLVSLVTAVQISDRDWQTGGIFNLCRQQCPGQVIVWVQINIDGRVVGWAPGRWCMHSKRVREGQEGQGVGKHGQAQAGYPGTWVPRLAVAVGGPNTRSRCQGPQLGGVRGKPNELKRLDVPVPVPTSRPPLAIRNESATRAGTACSFYQGWLGSTHLSILRTLPARHSTAQQSNRKKTIKTSPQTCPASSTITHSADCPETRPVCSYLHCTRSPYCILHCVALCHSSSPVSLSLSHSGSLLLRDRYTLGAHQHPPCLFFLTTSINSPPISRHPPPHTQRPRRNLPGATLLGLFPVSISVPLSSVPPFPSPSVPTTLGRLHRTHSIHSFQLVTFHLPAKTATPVSAHSSCAVAQSRDLPRSKSNCIGLDHISAHPYPDPPCSTPVFLSRSSASDPTRNWHLLMLISIRPPLQASSAIVPSAAPSPSRNPPSS